MKPEVSYYGQTAEFWIIQAAAFARAGRLDEADAILNSAPQAISSVRILDLQARIAAQSGSYERAKQLWQSCAELDPEQPSYRAALRRLGSLRGFWLGRAALLAVVPALVAALWLAPSWKEPERLRASLAKPIASVPAPKATPVLPPPPAIAGFSVTDREHQWIIRPQGSRLFRGNAVSIRPLLAVFESVRIPLDIEIRGTGPIAARTAENLVAAQTGTKFSRFVSLVSLPARPLQMRPGIEIAITAR